MESADRAYLKKEIIGIIEHQVREGDPPETQEALDRLLAAGYPREAALEHLGAALVEEIGGMLRERRGFDRRHFRTLLERLG
jgi:hypothetical protein